MKDDCERAFARSYPKIAKDIWLGKAGPNEVWLKTIFEVGYEARRGEEHGSDANAAIDEPANPAGVAVSSLPSYLGA